MKSINAFVAMVLLLISLSGCTLGPDFVKPDMTPPSSYRTDIMPAVSADDLKWWELFDDPVLFELVTAALENNRDIKIAVSRIEEARAALTKAIDMNPDTDIGQSAANMLAQLP